jgi:hypothetical protein
MSRAIPPRPPQPPEPSHAAAAAPDARLTQRTVLMAREDAEGLGYDVELSCGHTIWCAYRPANGLLYCGECLHGLAEELRARQRK